MEELYSKNGRLKYHPDYHENHGKPYTTQELAYICSTYRRGTGKQVSMAVGRTLSTIMNLVYQLKKQGMYEHYRKLGQKV